MVAQQPPERGDITGHDGGHCGLERGDRRARARKGLDVRLELRPAEKAMHSRDDKLRAGQRAFRAVSV
jgi:hypothetical protein